MGIFEWGAVAALVALGGVIWRLAWKMATQDGRIRAAETLAAGASGRALELGKDLAAHKEHVAAEYLSKDNMKEVIEAINRLGTRLDSLFMHFIPKP